MRAFDILKGVKMLGTILAILGTFCHPGKAADEDALKKEALEKILADRVAFEKERAQQQLARREEDERRKRLRQKEKKKERQPLSPPPPPNPSQAAAHQGGLSFASSLQNSVANAARSSDPHTVPKFQTEKPPESSLDAGSIGDAALAASRTNEASQNLLSQARSRPIFKFNVNTDPLFVGANQVIKDPHQSLNEVFEEIPASSSIASEELRTCEEGGDEYLQSCLKRLEIELKVTPEKGAYKSNCQFWDGGTRWCWKCFFHKHDCGQRYVITQHKKVETLREQWVDGCAVLEDLVDRGLCRYVGASRGPKNETRTIQGEPVTRDHFEEHYQFACFKTSPNSCGKLREQGCWQVQSSCKETIAGVCVLWEQTYACPSVKRDGKSFRLSGIGSPFCLTGDCADRSYTANIELWNVMGHLYALREAQNDLRNSVTVFKGQHRWCTRNFLDFRDCCGSGRGWGVTLHLSSCDAAEIELRTLRDKRLCVQVGTYCAEKALGVCNRKKTSFCCYGSKVARLIQEQGRAQLGMGFGTPESPDCNGLPPESLSRIDFSRVNFSDLFEDIRSHIAPKGQQQSLAGVSIERLKDNMATLAKPGQSPETHQQLKEKGL